MKAKKRSTVYLEQLRQLLSQARPHLTVTRRLEFKNVFGAVAGYVENQIFITCGKFGVALKLPPKTLVLLFEKEGAKPLKYFPNGHIKKDYAVIPKHIIFSKKTFKNLVDKSIRLALSQSK